jgi:hypothetical protein
VVAGWKCPPHRSKEEAKTKAMVHSLQVPLKEKSEEIACTKGKSKPGIYFVCICYRLRFREDVNVPV